MKASTLAIATLWTVALLGSAWSSLGAREYDEARAALSQVPILPQLLPIPFFAVMAWRAPYSPFFNPGLARLVDARAGAGAFETFLARLRPLLLFGVAAVLGAVLETCSSVARGASLRSEVNVFFLAGGIGFILAHWILRLRKVRGA
jgi:hypothetical protein